MSKPKAFHHISNIDYKYKKSWDKKGNYVEFELQNVNVSLINSIRRCIIGYVPTIGFRTEPYDKCTVDIIVNDSPLHNQFLAHRISMVPLNIGNVEGFNPDDWEFIIDVGNNTNFPQDVTTEHIKIRKISTDTVLSEAETKQIFPPDPITNKHIILTRLKPRYYMYGKVVNPDIMGEYRDTVRDITEEEVRLTIKAKACIGVGLENGHFNPTSCAAHSYKIDPERAKVAERAYIAKETEIAIEKNLTPYSDEVLRTRFATTYEERHYHQDARGNPTWFNFKVESIGAIPPLVIFHRSMNILKAKVSEFNSALIRNDSENIKIEPSKQMVNGYRLVIEGEDDTLGNILQYYMTDDYADMSLPSEKRLLNYVGYVRQHPLEMKIALTIQAINGDLTWSDIVEKVINPTCTRIMKLLDKLMEELEASRFYNDELKAIVTL
jgi:DNA-directed RNA polymerase subunit L